MAIKLVTIDIDDTLLNSKGEIMPTTHAAIKAAMVQGVHVALASGRAFAGVQIYLRQLEMTRDDQYVMTFNGAVVESVTGRIVNQDGLSDEAYAAMTTYGLAHHVPFNIVTADSEVMTRDRDVGAITALQAVENSTGILVRYPGELPAGTQIIKGVYCGNERMLDQAEAGVRQTFGAQYEVMRAGRPFLELMVKGVNKGSGAAHLAKHLGLTADEVMAFGDEDNDVTMFDYAGLAVAMGNGNAAAKAHADYITASNDADGLALALQKFVL